MTLKDFLEYNIIQIGDYTLNFAQLITVLLVLFGVRILVGVFFRTVLARFFKKRKVDVGRQFAIRAFLKYLIYTVAILWAMQTVGVKLSVIWGGAAALLVGIGLGLQQTFNDLISGIILLTEGTVEVGDVVTVDGLIGTVTHIGIRTSKVETRDAVSIIIPNSKLVIENATNWSHNESPSRFQVNVGVSYSSDIDLVTRLLLESAKDHSDVLVEPAPRVQFKDFGNSSLDFQLHYFSSEYLRSEFIKSEIRYRIIRLFRENNVEIPFPQRDLWIKNASVLTTRENGHQGLDESQ